MKKVIELTPIRESKKDWDELELKLLDLFKREIYYPILRETQEPKTLIANAAGVGESTALVRAIGTGQVQFYRGTFTGKFSAAISRDLTKLGATFDRKSGVWRIYRSQLPQQVQHAIDASTAAFQRSAAKIDEKLAQILPAEIADRLKIDKLFSDTIKKTERSFRASVRGITIAPELTNPEIERLAKEWSSNMKLFVKKFTEEHTQDLRAQVQKSVYAGNRREFLAKEIQKSFNVSANKAKFLARQETNLLMSKFKQVRYQSAGITEYKWVNVTGSPAHPVRPAHKELGDRSKKGETFNWNKPPLKTKSGMKNPGEDYNCRCTAVPVVRFADDEGTSKRN